LKKNIEEKPKEELFEEKVLTAYIRMKIKENKRTKGYKQGRVKWKPQIQDKVLVKGEYMSDASQGITRKFQRPYEGPFIITKLINSNIYEISDATGKVRGIFNIRHLKPYLDSNDLMKTKLLAL
jgi:hypothetical protein